MPRTLVLANQTLGGQRLRAAVRERVDAGKHEFYVVVPGAPVADLVGLSGDEGPSASERAYALAQQRLDRALAAFRELGASASGEVGDPDPLIAVQLALGRFRADEIIVSTLPLGLSRWLRGNLPSRLERSCGLPVQHVVADREPAS
jgi:antitoxin (DNA-binding transcriptional repressor) of toxin-antitoxin stability system